MSISKPKQRNRKPVEKYIKFSGSTGKFTYYEKYDKDDARYSDDTKGEEVEIDIDGMLVVESDLFSLTGFDKRRGFCYSNEVRSVEDTLHVRFFNEKEVCFSGNLEACKEELGDKVKYTKSVYALLNDEFIMLQLSGVSLRSWFDDIESDEDRINSCYINVKSIDEGKQGNVEYKFATFEFGDPASDADINKAIDFDEKKLQPYLSKHLDGSSSDKVSTQDRVEEETTDTSNWMEYESRSGKLGYIAIAQVKHDKALLEETNREDTEPYDMVCQAMKHYESFKDKWQSKKDKNKRPLSEYEVKELIDVRDKLLKSQPTSDTRFLIEQALESKQEDFEDDDIPF